MDLTYSAIMAAAVVTGFVLFRRTGQPTGLAWWEKLGIGLGAFCGGMIGAKLPFVLADWTGFLDGTAWFDDGKTIMSGLVGGYLGAQLAEWSLGVRFNCDSFAVPVAAAVGIGRLGCFHAGCCHGTVTSLPWGVDFGDGLARHPTQLYESAFHLAAALVLYQLLRRRVLEGRLIRVYFVSYFVYRFATEFIRPEQQLWLGLTGYQLAALVLAPFFALWCCPGCRPRAAKWRPAGSPDERDADESDRTLKETRTLCPTCLTPVTGETFTRHGKVFLRHECPEHGNSVALVSSDRRHYYLRDEVSHPLNVLDKCCTTGSSHCTCVAVLEITERCNLRCPVCFASSGGGRHRGFDELRADLEAFLSARGSLDVLQLSGGEPLGHPELLKIVDHCRTLPIDHRMINTNGLALLDDDRLAAELAARRPKLELSLQFDGLDAESYTTLRGADLLAKKEVVIRKIVEHDLPTTLVATVARGVNEGQLGRILRFGLKTRQLRGITYQPATWSGRFDGETDPLDRITLADVVRLLVDQSEGLFEPDDFKPLPCSNPNCCGFTFVVRRPGGPVMPLTQVVDYENHSERLADRMNFNLADARELCGSGYEPHDFFRIVIKPFMDAYTYDRDRIDECCVHIIQPGGEAVSFCHFNTLGRDRAAEPDGREASTCAHGVAG